MYTFRRRPTATCFRVNGPLDGEKIRIRICPLSYGQTLRLEIGTTIEPKTLILPYPRYIATVVVRVPASHSNQAVQRNASLWADVFLTKEGASPDPSNPSFDPQSVHHIRKRWLISANIPIIVISPSLWPSFD